MAEKIKAADGQWVTVNGRHILLKEGETLEDAFGKTAKGNEDLKEKQIAKNKEEADRLNGKTSVEKKLSDDVDKYIKSIYPDGYSPAEEDKRFDYYEYNKTVGEVNKAINNAIDRDLDSSFISKSYLPKLEQQALKNGNFTQLYAVRYLKHTGVFDKAIKTLDKNKK